MTKAKIKLNTEVERFKETFASELLEYHFEKSIGRNKNNSLPWRVLLEDNTQPHVDILCDLSKWLTKRWDKKLVEKYFFVVGENKEGSSSEILKSNN